MTDWLLHGAVAIALWYAAIYLVIPAGYCTLFAIIGTAWEWRMAPHTKGRWHSFKRVPRAFARWFMEAGTFHSVTIGRQTWEPMFKLYTKPFKGDDE